MPMNTGLKAKYQKQKAEIVYAVRIRSMCQPKERAELYDVVSKKDGSVISRAIPMEEFLKYGQAMTGYILHPIN